VQVVTMVIIRQRVQLEKINALKNSLVQMMIMSSVLQIVPMEKEKNNFYGKLQEFVMKKIKNL
jgi:hypothetical protein